MQPAQKMFTPFEYGRKIANAKAMARKSKKLLTEKEYWLLKEILTGYSQKKTARLVGRSANTLLRVSKSLDYADYRVLLDEELRGRKSATKDEYAGKTGEKWDIPKIPSTQDQLMEKFEAALRFEQVVSFITMVAAVAIVIILLLK